MPSGATSPADSSSPTAEATYGAYVSAVFNDVLQRPVDSGGLAYFSSQLAAGLPLVDMAAAIVHSDEYLTTNVILPDYQRFLGRPASAADVALWVGALQAGVSDEQFEAALLASDEFYRKAGASDAAWLDAAFQAVLNRAPDAAVANAWPAQLAAGTTRTQIAFLISASRENETQRINADYQRLLDRPVGDAAGFWDDQFADAVTNEDIVGDIVTTDEYLKRQTAQPLTSLPQGRDPAWWVAENQGIDARAQQGNVGVMFLGDSLTAGWITYADNVWNQYFGQYDPMQAGIPGDTTQNVLWRLQHGNLDGIHPKLVVLMIGTNNLNESDPPSDIAAGTKAIIDELETDLPQTKILLMGITPRGLPDDPMRALVAETNQITQGFAGGNVSYIDLSADLLTSDGNELPGAYQPDGAHLTALGYQIWAQAIQSTVAALMAS